MYMIHQQRGQISIFVALIFPILFVFFAMVINVGLVVHDKVNLQNSVDLAVYYGAQRQAEMLGAIAHANYQIRQSWKLLAFRYRVTGSYADTNHPLSIKKDNIKADDKDYLNKKVPSICLSHKGWSDIKSQQNVCHTDQLSIVEIPPVDVIAPHTPFNAALTFLIDELRKAYDDNCASLGPLNFGWGAAIFYAYKMDQANRRALIYALAEKLSESTSEFYDIEGESVREGMMKTLEKNLTIPNLESLGSVEIFNSMAHPALGGGAKERARRWLPSILISPALKYSADTSPKGGGCDINPVYLKNPQPQDLGKHFWLKPLIMEPSTEDLLHSSLGVEKNPWAMAYVGMKVQASPRKIFAPFGGSVHLNAKAFAKPFGGRMGPWMSPSWGRNDLQSNGPPSDYIDPLLPPRKSNEGDIAHLSNDQAYRYFPNHSRFPGDKLGLASAMAVVRVNNANWNRETMAIEDFEDIVKDVAKEPKANIMAKKTMGKVEMAAISPDLFDITYYSIDPNWDASYKAGLSTSSAKQIFAPSFNIRGDLAANLGKKKGKLDPTIGGQIEIANDSDFLNRANKYFYLVKRPEHVLTGWVGKGAMDYELNEAAFGQCSGWAKKEVSIPGMCYAGGRTGYSVKLVSKDYLSSSEFKLGGKDQTTGPLLNPPPEDF